MKISHYIKRSLSRQVIFLAGTGLLLFIVGSGILFFLQQKMQSDYIQERMELRDRRVVIDVIYDQYNVEFVNQ